MDESKRILELLEILSEIAHMSSDESNPDYDELINNMNKIQELTEEFKSE